MNEEAQIVPVPVQSGGISRFQGTGGSSQITHIAAEFKDIVEQHDIQGKQWAVPVGPGKHLVVEAWQYLGQRVGLIARTVETELLRDGEEIGYRAVSEVYDVNTGRCVGRAEQVCWSDEVQKKRNNDLFKRWVGPDGRPQRHAIMGMAQTRAQSRALASVLRFIAEMAGIDGTPYDEMDGIDPGAGTDRPAPQAKAKPAPAQNNAPPAPSGAVPNPIIGQISSVDVKTGTSQNGNEWKLFIVKTSTGHELTTFDNDLLLHAADIGAKTQDVEMHWETGKKEGQMNLTGVDPVSAGDSSDGGKSGADLFNK